MIWPGMLFNLCVGLLLACYLLRTVRGFERRADELMVRLDREHAARRARLDQLHDECLRDYDTVRDDIRASMRAQVDAAIAEMSRFAGNGTEAQKSVTAGAVVAHFATVSSSEGVATLRTAPLPSVDDLRRLPLRARVAFAARCARRVLPVLTSDQSSAIFPYAEAAKNEIDRAERLAAADVEVPPVQFNQLAYDAFVGDDRERDVFIQHYGQAAFSAGRLAFASVLAAARAAIVDEVSDLAVQAGLAFGDISPAIRRDFDVLVETRLIEAWTDGTRVASPIFGPLWPEGPPKGWPKSEHSTTNITIAIAFDVPDHMTTESAVEYVKELSAVLCTLDLSGGGHGIAIQPPLEITAPALVIVRM